MSGFIGEIAGQLAGAGSMLTQLLGSAEGAGAGGLPGLVAQFERAGLGDYVKSWVGHGDNLPITADHVTQALPPDQIAALAEKAGITPEQVSIVLAEILPHVVSRATPEGTLPDHPASP
jgi:uncharacterized protein YidB (DUF937 family)